MVKRFKDTAGSCTHTRINTCSSVNKNQPDSHPHSHTFHTHRDRERQRQRKKSRPARTSRRGDSKRTNTHTHPYIHTHTHSHIKEGNETRPWCLCFSHMEMFADASKTTRQRGCQRRWVISREWKKERERGELGKELAKAAYRKIKAKRHTNKFSTQCKAICAFPL